MMKKLSVVARDMLEVAKENHFDFKDGQRLILTLVLFLSMS
jgi:hypothetical protein